MYISHIEYKMLRVTGKFENDSAEVTVQLEEGEDVGTAVKMAKKACEKALNTSTEHYKGF